jgi:hypothetical protein
VSPKRMIANFSCENIVRFSALIDARMTDVALANSKDARQSFCNC